MGTRSLTFVYQNNSTKQKDRLCCMYRQFDGYPSGHGKELAEFLAGSEMVDGYGDKTAKQFNGMGCCAAQMVSHFKEGVGGFYLFPTNTKDAWQEYEYHVYHLEKGGFRIQVRADEIIFDGTLEQFKVFCEAEENGLRKEGCCESLSNRTY